MLEESISATRPGVGLHATTGRTWPRQSPATMTIAAVLVLTFAGLWAGHAAYPRVAGVVDRALWNTPSLVIDELWLWQVFTANFVHNGIVMLAVNVFFLLWLGPRLERFWGSRRFAICYLGSGVCAYALYDLYAGVFAAWGTTGGASGCVLGMATLYTLSFPKRVIRWYGIIRVPFRWIVLLLIFSDLTSFSWPGGIPWINHIVHLGGAAFGAGFWLVFGRMVDLDERS